MNFLSNTQKLVSRKKATIETVCAVGGTVLRGQLRAPGVLEGESASCQAQVQGAEGGRGGGGRGGRGQALSELNVNKMLIL